MSESKLRTTRIPVDSLTTDQQNVMTEALHQAIRSKCADYITAGVDQSIKKGNTIENIVVAIFDKDDPATPEPALKFMEETSTGYTARVYLKGQMVEFLKQLRMPISTAKVSWSKEARVWVDAEGKETNDFAKALPYKEMARAIEAPIDASNVWVVSFANCTAMAAEVRFVAPGESHLIEVYPNKLPDGSIASRTPVTPSAEPVRFEKRQPE